VEGKLQHYGCANAVGEARNNGAYQNDQRSRRMAACRRSKYVSDRNCDSPIGAVKKNTAYESGEKVLGYAGIVGSIFAGEHARVIFR